MQQNRHIETTADQPTSHARRAIAWLTLVAYIGQPMAVTAQVIAAQNAPGQNRPVIDTTANGIPLVQIAAPNAAGLSHNQYIQYNVDPNGMILNNSNTAVLTQQAGYVSANPNMANGGATAHIILNEVTGNSRSQLNGYTEVAGSKAEVIIANPNGIACNGCGFINTSRGVLTTGTPVFGGSGSLEAFRVTGGQIEVGAGGLNGTNLDQLDLITRSVKVNGELWGTNLNVVTGTNQVNYADLGVQVIAGDANKPTVGIDVAQLGGMYANKIRLIGTEAGVGVNSQGTLSAQAGDFTLDNQGQITLAGNTSASGNLTITGATGTTNNGTLYGKQAIQITDQGIVANNGAIYGQQTVQISGQTSINTGTLSAKGDLTLNGTTGTTNTGAIYSQQSVQIIDQRTITNSGTLSAQGNLTLNGANINSSGVLGAGIDANGNATQTGNLNIVTQNQAIAIGRNIAGGSMNVTAAGINLANSETKAAGDMVFHATAGDILFNGGSTKSNAGIAADATGLISNDNGLVIGSGLIFKSGSFSNKSGQIGGGTTDITSGIADNSGGKIYGNNALTIQASGGGFINQGGQFQTDGDLNFTAAGALNNQGGVVEAGGAASIFNLKAASIDNTGNGRIANMGAGSTVIKGGTKIDNSGGTIGGNGDLSIDAATLLNNQASAQKGLIMSGNNLTLGITNNLDNTNGQIYAFGKLDFLQTSASLNNTAGAINIGGAGSTSTFKLAGIGNQGGEIVTSGDLDITTASLNGPGQVLANGNLSILGLLGDYTNMVGNTLSAGGNLTLGVNGSFINQAALEALGTLTVTANANITNDASGLFNSNDTVLNAIAGNITNNGRIYGNKIHTNSNTLTNNFSIIGKDVYLAANNLYNIGAAAFIGAPNSVNLWVAQELQNTGGAQIYSEGDINIAADNAMDAGGNFVNLTQHLLNESSWIEAGGNINIGAVTIDNRRPPIATQSTTVSVTTKVLTPPIIYGCTGITCLFSGGNGSYATPATPPTQKSFFAQDITEVNDAAQTFNVIGNEPLSGKPAVYYDSMVSKGYGYQISTASTGVDSSGNAVVTINTQVIPQANIASMGTPATKLTDPATGLLTSNWIKLTDGTTTFFDTLDKQGDYFDVSYYPGYDPSVNIHPSQIRSSAEDKGTIYEVSRTLTTKVTDQVIDPATPALPEARILASHNINLNAGSALNNYVSTIAAGGNVTISGATTTSGAATDTPLVKPVALNNTALKLTETAVTEGNSYLYGEFSCAAGFKTCPRFRNLPVLPTSNITTLGTSLPSSITAGNAITLNGGNITNQSASGPGNQVTGSTLGSAAATAGTTTTNAVGQPNITLPGSGLYTINPQPGQNYLVVTDPRFTNYQNYISSEYMLERLTLDPALIQKRLGDGFYEQRLVTDQITQLTGRRFLGKYASAEEQFKALMDSGVATAKEFKLVPGVELTKSQVAALTSDIVWMVEEKVKLPDGSTTSVLAPKLYLSRLHAGDLQPNGAMIAAEEIDIKTSGTLANAGTIKSSKATMLEAQNVFNKGGTIGSAGDISIKAGKDILNQSGTISGNNVVLNAGHDIANTTLTQTLRIGNDAFGVSNTIIGRTGSIHATGSLAIDAGNDLSISGASIEAGGDATLHTGANLTVDTIVAEAAANVSSKSFEYHTQQITHLASTIKAGSNLTLGSAGDMHLTSAKLEAGNSATLVAGSDLTFDAAKNSDRLSQTVTGKDDFFAEKKRYDETVVGGTLNAGGNITVVATQLKRPDASDFGTTRADGKGNITFNSVAIASKQGGVAVMADANVNIGVTEEKHEALDVLKTTSHGMTTTTRRESRTETWRTDTIGSTVTGDNIRITSGQDINLTGTQVAAEHNIDVAAMGNLNISAATNTYGADSYSHESTTGLQAKNAFSITDHGPDITSKSHTDGSKQSQSRSSLVSKNGNLNLMAGGNLIATGSDLAADKGNLTLNAGGSIGLLAGRDTESTASSTVIVTDPNFFTKQKRTITDISNDLTWQGSTLQGKSVKLNSGGDLVLQASDVKAGEGGIALDAGGDIKLLAAVDQHSRTHTEKLQTDGYLIQADGAVDGNADRRINNKAEEQTVTNKVTKLVSGGDITTHSGGDTTLEASVLDAQGGIDMRATGYAGGTNADGTTYEGREGKIVFAGVKDSHYLNVEMKQNSDVWQSMSGHGEMVETLKLANIKTGKGLKVDAKGGIEVDISEAPKEAPAPVEPEAPIPILGADGKPLTEAQKRAMVAERAVRAAEKAAQAEAARKVREEQRFNDHIQQLAGKPGQEWIGQLAKMAKEQPDSVKLRQVNAALEHWDYSHGGMTPEATAVVVIVVTYFTAGAASGAGASVAGATGSAVAGAAVTAAVSTLASQAAVALLNNKGNIGKTLDDMGKSENVKALVTAMITAGVLQGIGQNIDINGVKLSDVNAKSKFFVQLEKNIINNATGAVINHAMYGGDLQQQLEQSFKSAFIDTGAAQSANWIGDMKQNGTFDNFTHKLAHAVAGCAIGAAKADSCGAGALGAVVGEISVELYGGNRTNSNGPDMAQFKTDAVNFAKMMAGIAVAITGGDANAINLAASTAGNAAENNYLNHQDNEHRLQAARGCAEGNVQDCEIRDALNAKDKEADVNLLYACQSNPNSVECLGATIDMRTQLATYYQPKDGIQLKDNELSKEDVNNGLGDYTAKSELQSYINLLRVSNQKIPVPSAGDTARLPNTYNSDPYGVMDGKNPNTYMVVKVGDQWGAVGSSDGVYTSVAGVNGILNETGYAPALIGSHVENEFQTNNLYTLYYNPTSGNILIDGLETFSDKLGFTMPVTKQFSNVLSDVQGSGKEVSWVAHSQGGAIFAEAVRYNGGDLSKNSVAFHSGANNEWVTNSILDKANVNEQYPRQKTTYWNSPIDFVPNVIGFNGNPLEILGSTLAIPLLFMSPAVSPHTLPYKPALPSSVSQGVTP